MKRISLIVLFLVAGGCGYSPEELEAAFRDGHRAGIIWCKREQPVQSPDLDVELVTQWRLGFEEATSVQCASREEEIIWQAEDGRESL